MTVFGATLTAWGVIAVYLAFSEPGISFLVPGETTFTITKPGNYTLWSEVSGSFDGQLKTFPTGLPPGATIKIVKKTDRSIVPVQSKWPTMQENSDRGFRLVIGKVRFDSTGEYVISAEGLQEKRGLHLDQFEFYKVFLPAIIGLGGPTLVVAGLTWGLLIILSSRKPRADLRLPVTSPPPLP